MSEFQLFLNFAWSIMQQFPIIISGSFVLFFAFIIMVFRLWVFPLLDKLKH